MNCWWSPGPWPGTPAPARWSAAAASRPRSWSRSPRLWSKPCMRSIEHSQWSKHSFQWILLSILGGDCLTSLRLLKHKVSRCDMYLLTTLASSPWATLRKEAESKVRFTGHCSTGRGDTQSGDGRLLSSQHGAGGRGTWWGSAALTVAVAVANTSRIARYIIWNMIFKFCDAQGKVNVS